MKDRSPRFWRLWQTVLVVLYSALVAFMLFGEWYSSMVENSANPRVVHVVCVLAITIFFMAAALILGKKYKTAREKGGPGVD